MPRRRASAAIPASPSSTPGEATAQLDATPDATLDALPDAPLAARLTATPGAPPANAGVAEPRGEGWVAPRAIAYVAPTEAPVPMNAVDDPDLPYWLALNRVKGIGPARFRLLLDAFGSAEAVWRAEPGAWQAAGLDARTLTAFETQRRRIAPEAELERLERLRVRALRLSDPEYPRLLSEIAGPPPVLYVRGALTPADDRALAIVGTRRVTTYGKQVTERFAEELAQQGFTVVSGLARGIDTHAHTAALRAGGRTLAVLGCGPDLVYPPENAKLAARMLESGAVVTEFAPGVQPEAGNFPARNRLISGLSLGVLVTECPDDSGALITARFAGEQGREVFAVPGPITAPSSRGANRLIQDGAKLTLELDDIVAELRAQLAPQPEPARVTRSPAPHHAAVAQPPLLTLAPEPAMQGSEARLLALLDEADGPLHIDELCRASGLPVSAVSGALVLLELNGQVRLVGPMTYVRER